MSSGRSWTYCRCYVYYLYSLWVYKLDVFAFRIVMAIELSDKSTFLFKVRSQKFAIPFSKKIRKNTRKVEKRQKRVWKKQEYNVADQNRLSLYICNLYSLWVYKLDVFAYRIVMAIELSDKSTFIFKVRSQKIAIPFSKKIRKNTRKVENSRKWYERNKNIMLQTTKRIWKGEDG
jgi:hypothetical protein